MKTLELTCKAIISHLLLFNFILMTEAFSEEIDYERLYAQTAPSVVILVGTNDKRSFGTGTGSIITKNGLVLTNTHVITNKNKPFKYQNVYLMPPKVTGNINQDLSRSYAGTVVAMNVDYDLALVQIINPPKDLRPLPLSSLQNVGIGEPTIAIGHPGGGGRWTLTTGRLSASFDSYGGRSGFGVFQTETSLNPGNSGGPLLDGTGSIIGINTFIIRKSGDMTITDINFAVKSTTATQWLNDLINKIEKQRKPQTPPPPKKKPKPSEQQTIKKTPILPLPKLKEKALVQPPKRQKNQYKTRVQPGVEFTAQDFSKFLEKFDIKTDDKAPQSPAQEPLSKTSSDESIDNGNKQADSQDDDFKNFLEKF